MYPLPTAGEPLRRRRRWIAAPAPPARKDGLEDAADTLTKSVACGPLTQLRVSPGGGMKKDAVVADGLPRRLRRLAKTVGMGRRTFNALLLARFL
ncbi:MAG: hypothetical protein KIT00_06295 [Rhodospirillales bacterium]|nr:hypothetical protein [Rhodospirillales bacterium]